MKEIIKPEMLIVAGTGRNSGKTTLLCNIIREFNQHPLVSVKVTPHFHPINSSDKILFNKRHLYVGMENNPEMEKDSALMLKAGAKQSFFVMAADEYLGEALKIISENIPDGTPILCESGGIRKWVKPGVFLMMNRSDTIAFKPGVEELIKKADKLITFNGESLDFNIKQIQFLDNSWILKN